MSDIAPTTPAQLETVLAASNAACVIWSQTTRSERATALHAIAEQLDAHADELVSLAMRETRLTAARLRGELTRTTFQLRLFAEVIIEGDYLDASIDHADAHWPMGAPRPDIRRTLVPVGPAVVFAASNFPFAFSVMGGDTASALAAGCSVVLKAHSGHPRLSQRTAEIAVTALHDAGAPAGIFAVIFGRDAGRAALGDARVKVGSFTGSIAGGRALFDVAVSRPEPIPFFGELGSVNPVIVTRAADTRRGSTIAEAFLGSMTMGAGQFCTKPGLLFVPSASRVATQLGDLMLPAAAPLLNEQIHEAYLRQFTSLRSHEAVSVLAGGADSEAAVPAPVVLRVSIDALLADPERLTAECFGPAALVVEYETEQQVLEFARECAGQLTSSLFAEDDEVSTAFVHDLAQQLARRAGRLLWNQWPTGVSVTYAQQHGGPYPATTAPWSTSVGAAAITRFLRPVAFQGFPQALLPAELRDDAQILAHRRVNGRLHAVGD